jgi:hypothetical protein
MPIRGIGVKQIDRATAQLPAKGLAELVSRLEDDHAQVWDKRIEEDPGATRLNALFAEVDEEDEAGLSTLL